MLIQPIIVFGESNYNPLTTDQAEGWLKSITYDELLDFIIKWDYIEHTTPDFNIPTYIAIVKGQDIFIEPEFKNSTYSHGYLSYTFTFPSYEYKNIIPKEESKWEIYLIEGLICTIGGAILGGWIGYEMGR